MNTPAGMVLPVAEWAAVTPMVSAAAVGYENTVTAKGMKMKKTKNCRSREILEGGKAIRL